MVVLWRFFVVVVITPVIYFVDGPRISATGTIRYRYAYRTQYRDAKLASAQRKRAARVHLDSIFAVKKNLQETACISVATTSQTALLSQHS